MRVLYVMDPITHINPNKDTTFALIEEGQARGHENFVCGVADVFTVGAQALAYARAVHVRRPTAKDSTHATLQEKKAIALDDFDVVWMRKDPPVDDVYLFCCMMLDLCDPRRTLVLNHPANLRVVHEKMWALSFLDAFPELMPRTVVSSDPHTLVDFVKSEGRAVLKPLHLMGGMGVFAFSSDDVNLRSAAELLTQEGKRPAIAQEFLPAVRQGDKRVILLDGKPVCA